MARFALSIVTVGCVLFYTAATDAAIITYGFTGKISLLGSPGVTPFGIPVSATVGSATQVNGQFAYDTASAGVISGTSETYQQSIPGGFRATFDSHSVSADSYAVGVSDRTGSSADILSVVWSSFSTPPTGSPIIIDDTTSYTVGRFSLTFNGPSTVFNTMDLPTSLIYSSFTTTKSGFLTESPTFVGGFFNMDSLFFISSVPEPATVYPAILGFFASLGFYRRRRMSGN